ncbi:MAG: ABC transporter permease [Leptospiraceae bacterium]|nr:ABC transporter permease [Leptospiraceae bacterium]MCB1201828.1 ABC transporter permease [Leptospiraceae bacterium]
MVQWIQRLGAGTIDIFEAIGAFTIFSGQTIRWIFARPFDLRNLGYQMSEIGVKSIPVGVVSSFFVGMVMALQLGGPMEKQIQGISTYMGGGISLAMVRELAPVLTAVLLAGRVGSSIAAEVGTMKVTEQIDALTTLATNPVHYLSVPRFLASVISLPLITVMAIVVGILGGAIISYVSLDIPFNMYFENAQALVKLNDLISGVAKTFFFGAEIALVSCFTGFRAKGGAEGVGQATIQAVVFSFMLIIVSDYFITYLFQLFGL